MNFISKTVTEACQYLASIDVSLQLLANNKEKRTTAFVNKKIIAQRLGVPSLAVDKLILQGISSKGSSGLVEGKHYCKLDPNEKNSSKFLYDPYEILEAAWSNFQYD